MADRQSAEARHKQAAETDVHPEAPAPTADPAAELQAALEAAEAKAGANWDNYLRASAELDNLRKRSQRDLENAHKFALERFIADLLPVKDSLEMGLSSAHPQEAAGHREGMELTLRLLSALLERYGVTELNPGRGEAFDPELHEAMAMQAASDTPTGAVLTTVQRGYQLNGRLLRPARVLVAKAPDSNGEAGMTP